MAAVHNMLTGLGSLFSMDVNIASDQSDVNLRSLLIANGWDGVRPVDALVTIASGIVVSATTTAVYALDTGTTAFPVGSRLRLRNQGFIIGRGGNANSGAGGPALRAAAALNITLEVDNDGGTIAGGGGAGGVGGVGDGYTNSDIKSQQRVGPAAGGQAGGGRTGRTNSSPNGTFASAGAGFAGSTVTLGAFYSTGGTGGTGGGWGASGSTGNSGYCNAPVNSSTAGSSGGPPGAAVVGNANISWANTGTRLGAIT